MSNKKFTYEKISTVKNQFLEYNTYRLSSATNKRVDIKDVRNYYKIMIDAGIQPSHIIITGMAGQYYTIKGLKDNDIGYGENYMEDTARDNFYDKFYFVDFSVHG